MIYWLGVVELIQKKDSFRKEDGGMERLKMPVSQGEGDHQKVLIVARHGEDDPTLTVELDQPLLPSSVSDVEKLGAEIVECFRRAASFHKIEIFSSRKKRAKQSSLILNRVFEAAGIPSDVIEEDGLCEFHQGRFWVPDNHCAGDPCPALVESWRAFLERLSVGDIFYRFGDPCADRSCSYPSLRGLFSAYGDSQLSFSLRLYGFLAKALRDPDGKFRILMTHQVVTSRIQRIIDSVCSRDSSRTASPGDFVRFHERQGSRIDLGHAQAAALDLSRNDLVTKVILGELEYLRSHHWS